MSINIQKDDLQSALKKLKARENVYKKLEEISGLGSWEVDFTNGTAVWSDRSFEIYGYKPQEFTPTSETFFEHALPEYKEAAKKLLEEMVQTKEVRTFYAKIRRKDGKIIDIILSGQFIDDNGSQKLLGTTQDITEYIRLQQEAQELLNILEKSGHEIFIIDAHYNYMYVNEGAIAKLGYSKQEFLSMNVFDINPYLSKKTANEIHEELLKKQVGVLNRSIHRTKDGKEYPVQSYLQSIKFKGKDAVIVFDTDISSLVELEKKQKEQAKILQTINVGVISTDLDGNVIEQNKAVETILGYKKIDNINQIYRDGYQEVLTQMQQYSYESAIQMNVTFQKANGVYIICELSLTQLKDENDQLYGIVWLFQDITDKRFQEQLLQEQAQQLKYQATHDALTGLPNRALFHDRLRQAMHYAVRYKKKFALLFVDLDRFKHLNDSYGHQFGDLVLLEIAKRLRSAIRQEDTLARLGGDEFTIILQHIEKKEDVSKIAQKIINALQEVMIINNHQVYTSVSIGISIYPDDSTDETNLIKYADSAMYKAKEEGRNQYKFYSIDMTSNLFEKIAIENNLRKAIEEENFVIYFQPQIDIVTNKVRCVEALVRWIHPEFGMIQPNKFIPIAEESGLITKIDRIVMKKAMKIFSEWKQNGLEVGKLSLNLAMKQLLENDFLEEVKYNFQKHSFQEGWLEFEVTEGDVMKNPHRSIEILKLLQQIGITISVDDFGTGYSSLSYLKKLPLNKLKIDRSFIMDIPANKDSMQIVNAIVVLAKSLNLDIVAEGVETSDQLEFLKEKECFAIQGYYFTKPLSQEEFEEYITKLPSFKKI